MKFNHLQKKHKYLKENEDTDYSIEHKNDLFDRSIIKNRPFLDRPGKIKFAKKHASADRPLHKLKNFTKETDFCQCCNLPCETKGIIEPFKICDSTDNFSQCGLGISLYFYFFRFIILCLFLVFIILGLPLIIFNNYYSNQLSLVCNSNKYSENFTLCEKYIDYNQYSNILFLFLFHLVLTIYIHIWIFQSKLLEQIKMPIQIHLYSFFYRSKNVCLPKIQYRRGRVFERNIPNLFGIFYIREGLLLRSQ